jgi:hypothetical protein
MKLDACPAVLADFLGAEDPFVKRFDIGENVILSGTPPSNRTMISA